ncbi:error-prone DNA polymerase [Actinoplanes palleronii]|uniref:Error-prone DNA polymerase n=1 Tax=Actinoplanes palleronii TaxID=113570 RepID=A0ABQ4B2Y9_9ACTN|nr:error-prone DNA polymerase [Actinoplanes palleronii]GIE64966.1 error-prone DNA polymerase [Actinoplanes palleronii]
MSFHNPDVPWAELERKLSGRPEKRQPDERRQGEHQPGERGPGERGPGERGQDERGPGEQRPDEHRPDDRHPEKHALWADLPPAPVVDPLAIDGDGGDSPAWSRKREPYRRAAGLVRTETDIDYAELHCHTNFSFLDGASHPEELAEEAARLGLSGLAVTDHDGFYGVVRFSQAAGELGLPTIFGAELSLGLTRPQNGEADPEGAHLLALAHGHEGYARLARVISEAQLIGGEKGRPDYRGLEHVAETLRDHVLVLTGCRKGPVPLALATEGVDAAAWELDRLIDLFGAPNVAVELTDHGDPYDGDRNDALFALAHRRGLEVVATGNVHYATPARRRLATALAAVRARRSLDEMDGWLPAAGTAHLRSGAEMARRFADYPGAVENAAMYGHGLAFDLNLVAPRLPDYDVPPGHTEMSWLRELTMRGARDRYGDHHPKAYAQLEHELRMIEELGFPGYFLVVYDIVRFCVQEKIYCQGRGSAANSAVCYALRITNVDAVRYNLLFERFLAPERDGPPDIDVDIESDRREEVIQHVYTKYGREHTAQVANVISYRPRSAVRDMARAFGFSAGQQDAWSKQIDRWGDVATGDGDMPEQVIEFANAVQNFPRHLGIHSGGMVICDRPIIEVCPVEWGRMPGRSVLQWDKDDCAAVDLVKFDLLGLGMLSALHYAYDMIDDELDIGTMPLDDPEVYAMLCRADSVGVFQVESRAQMATLPRLKPDTFYDLVIEVALIRPGPIQGGSVHPYIRRKNGLEKPSVPHPLMENALAKTLGVPLFQEQLMQLAIDVAGFDPSEADQLRRAMGSKRSVEKMERIRQRLYAGMAGNGITGELADDLFHKLSAFASYGFPESHAMSFAYLVYASAWLKRYHPAAFCAALLNAQPMGFYSPQTLVDDARRHGVEVRRPDINRSDATATLETTPESRLKAGAGESPQVWGLGGPAVRQGLCSVRTIGMELAERIESERRTHGSYRSMTDLARRTGCSTAHLEALATADAFAAFGLSRREALWAAGAASQDKPDRLPGTVTGTEAPMLPGMSEVDVLIADVWATGLSPETHPARFIRDRMERAGAVTIASLPEVEAGSRVLVGGIVTHRQRPATAGGVTFVNLEDETGMLNVTCSPGLWARYRRVARSSAALLVRGKLEKVEGVVNLVADRLEAITPPVTPASRDFR